MSGKPLYVCENSLTEGRAPKYSISYQQTHIPPGTDALADPNVFLPYKYPESQPRPMDGVTYHDYTDDVLDRCSLG